MIPNAVCSLPPRADSLCFQQPVTQQFFTQGIAVEPQHFRSPRLIATTVCQYIPQHWPLHLEQHHVIHAARRLTVQIAKIAIKVLFDAFADVGNFLHGKNLLGFVNSHFSPSGIGCIVRTAEPEAEKPQILENIFRFYIRKFDTAACCWNNPPLFKVGRCCLCGNGSVSVLRKQTIKEPYRYAEITDSRRPARPAADRLRR